MAAGNLIEVVDANFEQEVVSSELPVLVDFWGPMCGPCKALEPVVAKLADNYQGKLKVAKCNVDAASMTAIQYAVKSLPTLLLFKQGKVLDQFSGRPTPDALDKFVQRVL